MTVRATKYDGSEHWRHPATLVQHDERLVITRTSAGLEVRRGDGGSFISPYNTMAHYWPDRWFNAIRLELPGQGLYGYYCNIAMPRPFDGKTVRYVDLQLDVIARVTEQGGLRHWLVDQDEFEQARDRYGYDDDLIARCYAAVEEVSAIIERREFPFDG